jgi:outer membrane protein assembly factor BamA
MKNGGELGVFYNGTSSSLLNINENQIISSKRLPPELNWRNIGMGISYEINNLDYIYNPHKGTMLSIDATIGNRTIRKSNEILQLKDPSDPSFNFASLYDSIETKSLFFEYKTHFVGHLPISERSTLRFQLTGAWKGVKGTPLLKNENYFIGGNNIFRGFDDESILAEKYLELSTEFRLITATNSYLVAFVDAGVIDLGQNLDYPVGLGVGLNLETQAGIFGLYYAVGSLKNTPFDVRNSKIHFGYVNLF